MAGSEVGMTTITVTAPESVQVYVMGEVGVGRFSLLRRFHDNVEPDEPFHMHERVANRSKQMMYEARRWELFTTIMNLTDCRMLPHVGSSRYVVMLVYDITDSESFKAVSHWLDDRTTVYKDKGCPVVLIGTHSDLRNAEAKDEISKHNYVKSKKAKELAETLKIPIVMTSAKNNVNIQEAFEAVLKAYIEQGDRHAAAVNTCCCVII